MSASPLRRALGAGALVYAAAMWGSTFFLVKDTLAHVDAIALVAYRFLLAGALLAIVLALRGHNLLKGWAHGLWLGVVLWILYGAQTIGLGITTASNSGFITGLFIVFTPLVAWLWLRRRPTLQQTIAVAIALFGLWLLTGGIHGANAGDVMTLAAAVTYAIHVVYAGQLMERGVNPWVLNCQQIIAVGALSLLTLPVQAAIKAGAAGAPYGATLAGQFTVTSLAGWGQHRVPRAVPHHHRVRRAALRPAGD